MQRLFLGLILAGLLWTIGLAVFITQLPAPSAQALEKADGIVVYTGGGGARIAAGMKVFADGGGERLLISGVHPDTSRKRLSELWAGAPDLFDCCVDLGREARSTEGNAAESAGWAEENKFDRVIIVTSDYHMPRAIAVTKARMPNAEVTPYVVASSYLNEKGRPQTKEAWEKIAGEYTKYLLARVKSFFTAIGL